jgi:hypothetical protein
MSFRNLETEIFLFTKKIKKRGISRDSDLRILLYRYPLELDSLMIGILDAIFLEFETKIHFFLLGVFTDKQEIHVHFRLFLTDKIGIRLDIEYFPSIGYLKLVLSRRKIINHVWYKIT